MNVLIDVITELYMNILENAMKWKVIALYIILDTTQLKNWLENFIELNFTFFLCITKKNIYFKLRNSMKFIFII